MPKESGCGCGGLVLLAVVVFGGLALLGRCGGDDVPFPNDLATTERALQEQGFRDVEVIATEEGPFFSRHTSVDVAYRGASPGNRKVLTDERRRIGQTVWDSYPHKVRYLSILTLRKPGEDTIPASYDNRDLRAAFGPQPLRDEDGSPPPEDNGGRSWLATALIVAGGVLALVLVGWLLAGSTVPGSLGARLTRRWLRRAERQFNQPPAGEQPDPDPRSPPPRAPSRPRTQGRSRPTRQRRPSSKGSAGASTRPHASSSNAKPDVAARLALLEAWQRLIDQVPEEDRDRSDAWLADNSGVPQARIAWSRRTRNQVAHPGPGEGAVDRAELSAVLAVVEKIDKRLRDRNC